MSSTLTLENGNVLTFYQANNEIDNITLETDTLLTVSKFKLDKIRNSKGNVQKKEMAPFMGCPISCFGGFMDNESIMGFFLKNGISNINWISFWKSIQTYSDSLLRIIQGKGRVLRFRNKQTKKYHDLSICKDFLYMHITENILNDYTIEFPQRKRIKSSTIILFNFILTEKSDCVFDNVNLAIHQECPICYEDFKETESVFYPHDKMHPICSECVFRLNDNKCPLCRQEFSLF
jgi:hypothetical protein